ncbi:Asp-tRNA(Asn)/Glu-tRNA(Gln) amidotransferase subunit GatC [Miniphocaeibacter halophilus]|uniref:Asp-tRNA(Asn)/Glu-tRNA(Gln) amidotransferase subunit GatC n=1 Tax=Miniphocaeibacter halophilus TaxID=2931922 RepID=A0AC61MT01_9FIRM|nr:Asp-tRNA(Asn)/Glu-tRNA(Gln) amidotransferase subunit GatC [Miniphocaeibacter halophilus]QQK07740.1 Asp-tRNA(Asn)/Glu-tRNA(Gln) amidotransferase subunit GatC [Miniphocaeibacter halophilus]
MIDINEVKRVYSLAKLNIREDELEIMKNKFNTVLEFANSIMEVDTEEVDMLEMVSNHKSVLREDNVEKSVDREMALKNSTDREYGYFRLKKVVE